MTGKYNWGLIFSTVLLLTSGISFLRGDMLNAIYAAVVAVYWGVLFND